MRWPEQRCSGFFVCRKIIAPYKGAESEEKMKIINLLNMKGGVAKTFTVVNMAYELWRRDYKVLLLDNDKQGNTSRAYRRYDAESISPAARILGGEWECRKELSGELIQPTDYDGIDIITTNMSLFGATCTLMGENSGDITERYKKFLLKGTSEEGTLICDKYDYCIIDNPPDIGINVINVLAASDEVIVPVKIDEDALEGLDIVAEQIEDAKAINPSLTLKGVLVTSYQNTDGESAGLEWLKKQWEDESSGHYRKYPILGIIRYSKKVAENSFLRKPIYEYSPCCGAAQDYKKFITAYTRKGR